MISENASSFINKAKFRAFIELLLGSIMILLSIICILIQRIFLIYDNIINCISVVVVLLLITLGVIFIVKGKKKKKLIKTYYNYSKLLYSDCSNSIQLLSVYTGVSVETVLKKIMYMFRLGLFSGSFIDTAHNRIIFHENIQN